MARGISDSASLGQPIEMPQSGMSEFERREMGQHSMKGEVCVGLFAHANTQHP